MSRLFPCAILMLAAVAVVTTACGGSGKSPGTNASETDPALVASSTPIQNAPLYVIVGDTITLGGKSATVQAGATTPANSSQTYTVVSGDTCSGIAAQFNISLDALQAANGGPNGTCSTLAVGDTMKVPAPATATPTKTAGPGGGGGSSATKTPSSTGRTYTVQAGDTCYGIAQKLGVDANAFVAANSSACSNLQQGDTLKVP